MTATYIDSNIGVQTRGPQRNGGFGWPRARARENFSVEVTAKIGMLEKDGVVSLSFAFLGQVPSLRAVRCPWKRLLQLFGAE